MGLPGNETIGTHRGDGGVAGLPRDFHVGQVRGSNHRRQLKRRADTDGLRPVRGRNRDRSDSIAYMNLAESRLSLFRGGADYRVSEGEGLDMPLVIHGYDAFIRAVPPDIDADTFQLILQRNLDIRLITDENVQGRRLQFHLNLLDGDFTSSRETTVHRCDRDVRLAGSQGKQFTFRSDQHNIRGAAGPEERSIIGVFRSNRCHQLVRAPFIHAESGPVQRNSSDRHQNRHHTGIGHAAIISLGRDFRRSGRNGRHGTVGNLGDGRIVTRPDNCRIISVMGRYRRRESF